MDSKYNMILDDYIKKYDSLQDIWINFERDKHLSE